MILNDISEIPMIKNSIPAKTNFLRLEMDSLPDKKIKGVSIWFLYESYLHKV